MKFSRLLLPILVVVIGGIGLIQLTSSYSVGQFQNTASATGEEIDSFETGNLSKFIPLNVVGECSDSQYPNCYTNTFSDYGLSVDTLVAFEDMPRLKFEDNTFLIRSDDELSYECDGVYAFRTKWRDDWSVEYSRGDISADYPSIDPEGSVDLSNYEGDEGVMIICGDETLGDDGAYVATTVAGGYQQNIEINEKPVIEYVNTPDKVFDDQSAEFSVSVTDPNSIQDSSDLTVSWSNGESGSSADYSFDETGEQSVSVEVSDGEFTVSESVSIDVLRGNKRPVIESLNIPSKVEAGERFNVSAVVSDPDGDDLSVMWSNGDTGRVSTYRFGEPGNYTVGVTVSDGELSVSDSKKVEVVKASDDENDGFLSSLIGFFSGLF